MPIYEYKCQACNLVFEARQKFSDAPLTGCRACGGSVEKLISQAGFALKGDGWYDQGYSAKKSACAAVGKSEGCAACPKAVND